MTEFMIFLLQHRENIDFVGLKTAILENKIELNNMFKCNNQQCITCPISYTCSGASDWEAIDYDWNGVREEILNFDLVYTKNKFPEYLV